MKNFGITSQQRMPREPPFESHQQMSLDSLAIPPMGIFMERCDTETKPLLTRINRIAGQVQGVGRMIEENRECPEILHTISAIHSALRGLESKLLEDHVRHCVADAVGSPKQLDQRLDELVNLYRRRLS